MFGYNNYYDPVSQGMQQRFNTARTLNYTPSYTQNGLRGRIVTSIDEARAAQIELDGSPSFFPSPMENKIYVKSINLNGMPEFSVYTYTKPEPVVMTNNTNEELNTLKKRIEKLETLFGEVINNDTARPNENDDDSKLVK